MSKILVGKQLIAGQTTPINYTKKIVSLTQSQYDVLVQQGQVEADQLYWITDGTDSDIISDVGVSLDTTYSSQHEQALLDSKANKASTYSKAETDSLINSKLSSALKYKGVVATVADLSNIVDPDNGDSYVVTADGIMYAYNQSTSQWDALGAPMDLTNYYTKDEVDAIIEDLQIKIQYDTMPQASIDFDYPIQYTGSDTNDYKNGHFYRVVNDGTDYVWEEVIGDSQIIEDVNTLPVSNIKDMFYRVSNFEETTLTYDSSAQVSEDTIYAIISPYGFAKGQRYSNYLTSTSQTLQTVVMLTNPNPAFVEIITSEKNKVNFYLYKKDSNSGWNIGCYAVDQAIDRLYLENDTITFWLEEGEVLYAGNKANQTTTKVGSVDADETTIIKNQDGTISVSPDFKKIFNGTEEEFLELDVEERKKYDYIADTDDLVNGSRHYSTTETKTGMYWIDGKPIYRQVINVGTPQLNSGSWVDLATYSFAVDAFVSCTLVNKTSDSTTGTQLYNNFQIRQGSSKKVEFLFEQNITAATSRYVILEYTKTTD